ncbi:MAG: hypothetical protein CMD61_02120 [Gammaproteobacteria bacterium]|nr:hypothetical protein [Gammaproteobacteria bacterium]
MQLKWVTTASCLRTEELPWRGFLGRIIRLSVSKQYRESYLGEVYFWGEFQTSLDIDDNYI